MEDTKNDNVIDNPQDKQKLIHTYLEILKVDYKTPFESIIMLLEDKFKLQVTTEDLMTYFEPTLEEFTSDLELQFKNLNLIQ